MSSDADRSQGVDRVTVNTSVAVRGAEGFFFGTLKWIEPRRVLVELDADLAEREGVDVRITLSPTSSTALFRGFVGRSLATAQGETPRYLILIHEFMADDKEKFDTWLKNVRSRGTFSNFDTVVSDVRSGSARSSSEVRQALEQMARRPLGSASSPPTDPFGTRSDIVTNSELGGGRSGVRDALRSALARRATGQSAPAGEPAPGRVVATTHPAGLRGAEPTPPLDPARTVRIGGGTPSVTPDPTRTVRIGSTPSVAPTRPTPPAGPPLRDPTYATTTTRDTTWMEVRWHEASVFERDARLQLCNYILVLSKADDPLPDREPVKIVVRHGDLQVECAASIKAVGPNGATYRLLLDALQLERLRGWIADYGRK